MKPFLGINITKNKNQEDFNGTEFITRKVSSLQAEQLEKAVEHVSAQEEKSSLAKPFRIAQFIFMMLGLVCVYGTVRALGGENDLTLAQAYQNAPAIFWIGGGSLVIWGLLAFWGRTRKQQVETSDESRRAISYAEQVVSNGYSELGVPSTAANMDVLMFRYVEKMGKIVPRSFGPVAYIACDCKVFTENGNLCITDANQRYEFPLSEIRSIETVKKDIAIPTWNKDIPTNKPPYKQYKLRIDSYGFIHCKPYYILHLEHNGEDWGIYFPSYELPTIETLTGHHPE